MNLATNINLHLERSTPGAWRAWRCPLTFCLGGQQFETIWEYNEAPPASGDLQRLLEADLLLALENAGFYPL